MKHILLVMTCVVLAFLVSGCRASLSVGVVVATDGSGEVLVDVRADDEFLDAAQEQGFGDAVAVLGDAEAAGEAFADAVAAGWEVDVPESGRVVLRHEFEDPDEVQGLLASVAGPGVLFERFEVTTGGHLLRRSVDVDAILTVPEDFHAQLLVGLAGDAPGGAPSVEELREVLGVDLATPPPVEVSLGFEGRVTDIEAVPPPDETVEGDGRTVLRWHVAEGTGVAASIRAESWTWVVWALIGVVILALAGAAGYLVYRRRR